jgi:NADPH:quinone reductase-like Zn-dependent oxidoreductase
LLDHFQSAVVPISALTAWQGLLEKAGLQSGQRVLIHGAAGGVGVFAVQLARWRGAHVIATASSANVDFVRRLGAREVLIIVQPDLKKRFTTLMSCSIASVAKRCNVPGPCSQRAEAW